MVITRMIHTLMLTMLVIYLPYVGATIGASCQGNSDCDSASEACSSLGRCQCKSGYRIHIFPSGCNPVSPYFGPCQNISTCMICNTTFGFGTCMCQPSYYEYQGTCYLNGRHGDACYSAEGCRLSVNLVCNNSVGGTCVCQTGFYLHVYSGRCTEKGIVGHSCYSKDECRDEHAWCNLRSCQCMNGYYAHNGSCIQMSALGETCHNVDGCIGDHVVCDNTTGFGICRCSTGYYANQGFCYEMPDAPNNLQVLNVTSRAFTIWLEKPNKVFGELLGYVLTIKLANTGRCVKEYIIRCESGCVNPFPNETAVLTTCPLIIQYQSVSREDLVMMERKINTLGPGTVYWVSVAAVSQYGKGFTRDINVTTLHEGDLNVMSHLESNSISTIIIVSIACGTLIVTALMAAGTVIIIKRRRTSKCKCEADASSTYMDLPCKTNEDHYDTLAVTSAY